MVHQSEPHAAEGLEPWIPDPRLAPDPDPAAEPEGYVVADGEVQVHFHDWGGPDDAAGDRPPAVLLVPGLQQTAWSWAPVARRLRRVRRTLVADLRGQGLSDSPPDGYDLDTLAADAVAVADVAMAGATEAIVVAGHGFGAVVAAAAAERLGTRCAGLVLVDGGWERLEATTGLEVDEFLRGIDEPPDILRSLDAWLASRRAFDPSSWDADQERAARDGVVETAAGRVVRTVRPFVVDALVRTMFRYDPALVLPGVSAPIVVLVATDGIDLEARLAELARAAVARTAAGAPPMRLARLPAGHNLMRYQPAVVTATILAVMG